MAVRDDLVTLEKDGREITVTPEAVEMRKAHGWTEKGSSRAAKKESN